MTYNNFRAALLVSAASLALSGCGGANDVASPGNGGVVINNPPPAPTPAPTPTPTPPSLITPATGCPTIGDPQGLTDAGTITGPTGTWRVCSLPRTIRASSTLPKITGLLYQIPARVDVGCDSGFTAPAANASFTSSTANCTGSQPSTSTNIVLTIEPGVTLFGGSGASWLAVNRGSRISAIGTITRPIVFTSRDNVLGLNTDSSSGQWGGVVLHGRAPITDCRTGTPGANCERETEGATDPATYGGADSAYNAGRMSFVQIRYSGFILSGANELQALTAGGVGTGTVMDHIQSYNSSDDAMEFFGGSPRLKYFVAVGAEDDNLDTDVGAKARIQHVVAIQRPGIGDAMIEADSDNPVDEDVPRQNTFLANFTFNYRSTDTNADGAAMLLRGKTDYTMLNGVVSSLPNECLAISRTDTATRAANPALDEAGPPVFQSVNLECKPGAPYLAASGVTVAQIQAAFGSGTNGNLDSFVSSLANLYINGANETARPAVNPATFDPFFDVTTYVGAVQNAANDWTVGWTCNSATASFGTSTSGQCSSIPTY